MPGLNSRHFIAAENKGRRINGKGMKTIFLEKNPTPPILSPVYLVFIPLPFIPLPLSHSPDYA
jgi:hypothetical protein